MEFCDGVKISDRPGLQKLGVDLADVDSKMIKAFAEQIFHTGFVHADPHPGNSKQQQLIQSVLFNFFARFQFWSEK